MPEANAGWRRSNIGHVLFAASDRFLLDKLDWIHAHGFPDLTDAQLTLLLSLDDDGTRPTDIAARANLTKSSIAELVDRSAQRQLVERRTDRDDNRSRIVGPTARGRQALMTAREAIARAERAFTEIAGTAGTERFKQEFGAYAAELALPSFAGDDWHSREWHSANVGRVLALSARRFVREVLSIVHAGGHREIGETLLSLLRNLDLEGTRLTDLAERAHMTKQSMRELVDRTEVLGVVRRETDPADRRAKIIHFTTRGLAMLDDMQIGVTSAEQRLGERIGATYLAEVHRLLRDYVAQGRRDHPIGPITATEADRDQASQDDNAYRPVVSFSV